MRYGGSKMVTVLAVAAAVAMGASIARAQSAQDYQRILKEKSPAFVTIKYLLQVKMGGMGEVESEMETTGVLIDSKGLVLASNTQLGGIGGFMRSLGQEITTTPTDIKVLIGEDVEGLEARVVARDTELDLAWVRLKEEPEKPLPYVDLKKAAGEAQVGQPLVGVRRLSKFFDRVSVVNETRVAGTARKPRRLYVPTLPLTSNLGLPLFTTDGQVLGVAVLQTPSEEDMDESPAAMFSRMASLQEMMSGVILPADEVVEATRRALEVAGKQAPAGEQGTQQEGAAPQGGDDEEAGQGDAPIAQPAPSDEQGE